LAKPTTLPIWATDGTNNTEPSLSQKQSGWTPNQDGVSDYDNWYKRLVYDWCAWLDGADLGAMTFSTIHVTGTSALDGVVTFGANPSLGATKLVHGDRRRAYSSPTFGSYFTGAGIGTPASAGSGGGFETGYTLSLTGGQVTEPRPEYGPGDRIKSLRVTHEGVGNPTVKLHYHRYGGGPDYLTTTIGTTTTIGGYKVTEYTVDSPAALGHHTASGALSPAHAGRVSVFFEAGTDSTTIFGYEITHDSIAIPADVV